MASSLNLNKSPTTFGTTVEQKIRSRNAAMLIKTGSPKLRDLLREVNKKISSTKIFIITQHLITEMSYKDEGSSVRLVY